MRLEAVIIETTRDDVLAESYMKDQLFQNFFLNW